ncbi:hypothetical protein [Catellatospora methionotrophica]|uniref:hypothetical protein n=1 Tax=Catellatospora methionotrophica TaxID=121620 RepID=UPI0033F6FF07
MQIVAAATAAEKQGFVVLSGQQATDSRLLRQVIDSAGTGVRGIGVEVEVGAREGLCPEGVVRVALARDGHVFCTWQATLTKESLIERAGELSPAKLDELANALRLARVE